MSGLAGRAVAQDTREIFMARYGALFEHSPWVVERAWDARPFADAAALHEVFLNLLFEATGAERLRLIRAHPELADKVAQADGLTASSAAEQASAGLTRLSPEEFELFHDLNAAYRGRFGFPFIICVRLHSVESILTAMQSRMASDPASELREALTQIGLIVGFRLAMITP